MIIPTEPEDVLVLDNDTGSTKVGTIIEALEGEGLTYRVIGDVRDALSLIGNMSPRGIIVKGFLSGGHLGDLRGDIIREVNRLFPGQGAAMYESFARDYSDNRLYQGLIFLEIWLNHYLTVELRKPLSIMANSGGTPANVGMQKMLKGAKGISFFKVPALQGEWLGKGKGHDDSMSQKNDPATLKAFLDSLKTAA